jgi:hypothetical protein
MLPLFAGCLLIDDAMHADRMAQAEALFDTDTAGDTDDASGTAPDTGVSGETGDTETGDTETGDTETDDTDTGASPTWDGSYAGAFTLRVDGVLGSDTCTGTVALSVDEAGEPALSGEAACSYAGVYAAFGQQEGTIQGLLSGGDASGAIEFGSAVQFADVWTGAMGDGPPARLSASFSGTADCDGGDCDYEGSFEAERAE